MKSKSSLFIVPILVLGACKSTGVDRAEGTAQSVRDLHTSLQAAPAQIDAVTASLTELAKGEGDMRMQYQAFCTNVDALLSHREQIRSLNQKVQSNRQAFAQEWEKHLATIQDANLRGRASERQKAVAAEFEGLAQTATKTRQTFEPWAQKVVDVRAYLENDLNPSGIASVSDEVSAINDGADEIKESIADVLEQMEELATKIAATKPPPPTTTTGS